MSNIPTPIIRMFEGQPSGVSDGDQNDIPIAKAFDISDICEKKQVSYQARVVVAFIRLDIGPNHLKALVWLWNDRSTAGHQDPDHEWQFDLRQEPLAKLIGTSDCAWRIGVLSNQLTELIHRLQEKL